MEVLQLNEWLAASAYRDDAIALTRLGWHATYAKLYRPALIERSLVVSNYTTDETIRSFMRSRRPTLLITAPEDAALRERFERQLGAAIGPRQLVKTIGKLMVFDIREPK